MDNHATTCINLQNSQISIVLWKVSFLQKGTIHFSLTQLRFGLSPFSSCHIDDHANNCIKLIKLPNFQLLYKKCVFTQKKAIFAWSTQLRLGLSPLQSAFHPVTEITLHTIAPIYKTPNFALLNKKCVITQKCVH